MRGPAFFAYANNYLIDVKSGIITDVEASRVFRQAEVGAPKIMIERPEQCFDIKPTRLAADTDLLVVDQSVEDCSHTIGGAPSVNRTTSVDLDHSGSCQLPKIVQSPQTARMAKWTRGAIVGPITRW
jgi:hypothetical protein